MLRKSRFRFEVRGLSSGLEAWFFSGLDYELGQSFFPSLTAFLK
jgi:hypothetical protein